MENRQSIVSDVPELDFTQMVIERMNQDELVIALPFLEKSRATMDEKVNFHSAIVRDCEKARDSIDRLIAAATEQVGISEESAVNQVVGDVAEEEISEAAGMPEEEISEVADVPEEEIPVAIGELSKGDVGVRCGQATASDIEHCKKYRHALVPIAKRNGGYLDVEGATKLIMSVMETKTTHHSMKGSLVRHMRDESWWEEAGKGLFKLLEVDEEDGVVYEEEAVDEPEIVNDALEGVELVPEAA